MTDKKLFSERLDYALAYRNKKPISLTNDIGIPKSAVHQYLNNIITPKHDRVKVIAEYLNINPYYLFGESDEIKIMSSNVLEHPINTYGDYQAHLDHFSDKPELLEIYHEITTSDNLRLLFDSAKDLTPKQLESILVIIQSIKEAEARE